jgi:hypothetical protein
LNRNKKIPLGPPFFKGGNHPPETIPLFEKEGLGEIFDRKQQR